MLLKICLFFNMAGRRSALQWRKLARQNCLRGRAARYVAAAALWLVAACGCCLALLLPLTMLLGVLAAVLLPSFLRCVQLRYLHGLLGQEALLLEFVQLPAIDVLRTHTSIMPSWSNAKLVD